MNLVRTAGSRADKIAIKLDDFELSYAVLDQATNDPLLRRPARAASSFR